MEYPLPNQNHLVEGPTGTGKTTGILLPEVLHDTTSNFILACPKDQIIPRLKEYKEKQGYRTYWMDFDNNQNSEYSFEILSYVYSDDDCKELAQGILDVDYKGSTADPYWADKAAILLHSMILYVMYMNREKASIADVAKMVASIKIDDSTSGTSVHTSLDKDFDYLEERSSPDHPAVVQYKDFLSVPPKTARCALDTLKTTMSHIFTQEVCQMIERSKKIDLLEFVQEKSIIFISDKTGADRHEVVYRNLFFSTAI